LQIGLAGEYPVIERPDPDALAALKRVDPHGVRLIEFSSGSEAAERYRDAAQRELSR
jgi:hypothetical protein